MIIKNALVFRGERGFVPGTVKISGDRFAEIAEGAVSESSCADSAVSSEKEIDLRGAYLIPGLIDIHTHGNSGCDFSDGDRDGLVRMGQYLAAHGVTSFLPTSMTLPYEALDRAFQNALQYTKGRPWNAARIAGIHMEGPFFSEKKKGAQNSLYLRLPDAAAVKELDEKCEGLLRIVDVAPELTGAVEFTKALCGSKVVSVAHTDAGYEETKAVFEAGAAHVTHLFNAMPGIHHRMPGVIGAAAETENVNVELICDGRHIHPSIVRMAFKLFPGRLCMISDSIRCCGKPEGVYDLGGIEVHFKDGAARLADGTLAGAAANLFEGLRNVVSFGIPPEKAIMAATIVPAQAIGRENEIGSIEAGKYADFVVCDEKLNILQVYLGGKLLQSTTTPSAAQQKSQT